MRENDPQKAKNEFEQAGKSAEIGFFSELIGFLKTNKRWWLTPIVICLLLLGILLVLGSTGAAPFIYSLF
jgi:hypothetical protein